MIAHFSWVHETIDTLVAALAPTIAVVVTYMLTARRQKQFHVENSEKMEDARVKVRELHEVVTNGGLNDVEAHVFKRREE